MKKLIYCALALAAGLFATSCMQENLEPVAQGNTVTYTVEIPDVLLTKAIGDDVTKVDELVYEVYRTKGERMETFTEGVDNLLYHKTAVINNGTAIISLEFVNNQNFTVLFWAHTKDNGVYDASDLTDITITSPDVANNVNAQAFVGRDFVVNSVSDLNRRVTLKRPVSQLNIGTTEASLTAFNTPITLSGSSVKVKGLSTSYNVAALSAGQVSDVEYEYTETEVPSERLRVGTTEYIYVGMNYVGFAANEGSTVKVSYAINTSEGEITKEISNVPVKPNYRTNIVGNLITSTSSYTIELDEAWGTDGNGTMEVINNGVVKNVNGDYEVTNAEGLAYAMNYMFALGGNFYLTEAEYDLTNYTVLVPTITEDLNIYGETPVVTRSTTTVAGVTIKGLDGAFLPKVDEGSKVTVSGVTLEGDDTVLVGENDGTVIVYETTADTLVGTGNDPVAASAVSTIDELKAALEAGAEEIKLVADIEAEKVIEISKSVVINGNEKKITSSDSRVIRITASEIEVVINDLNTFSTKERVGTNDIRGISIDPSLKNVSLTLNNCSHVFTHESANDWAYAVNVSGSGTGHKLTVNGGSYEGANVINVNGAKNTVIVKGATLTSNYPEIEYSYGACIYIAQDHESSLYAEGNIFEGFNAYAINVGYTPKETKDNTDNTLFYYSGGMCYYASSAEKLQYIVSKVTKDAVIKFGNDIVGDLTIVQKEGVNLVIDGDGQKFDGKVVVDGNNRNTGAETLTIRNINFETTFNGPKADEWTFITSTKTNNYAHNVVIEDCTFKNTVEDNYIIGSVNFKTPYKFVMRNCTAENMHSLLQLQSVSDENILVENVVVENCKNGISFGNTYKPVLKNSTINSIEYGVRGEATDARACTLTVENTSIEANLPITVRKVYDNVQKYTVVLSDNVVLTAYNDIDVVFTKNAEEFVLETPVAGTWDISGAEGLNVYPRDSFASTAEELITALKNAKEGDIIKLAADIIISDNWDARYTGAKTSVPVVIDGLGHTLKFTNTIDDKNYSSVFRFENDAVVKNLKFDLSEAVGTSNRFRAISAKTNLTVDNCEFIGNPSVTNTRGIIFGEGQSKTYDATVSITNCNFVNWRRGITDNENATDVKEVLINNNNFDNANVVISAYEKITFNGNKMYQADVNITSYTASCDVTVQALENSLYPYGTYEIGSAKYHQLFLESNVNAQTGFTIYTQATINTESDLQNALKNGDAMIVLGADINLSEPLTVEGQEVVFNLNGHLVTADAFDAFVVKTGGKLTLKNGRVISHGSVVRAIGGEIVIENGTYTQTGTAVDSTPATNRYAIDSREGGKITINGGEFSSGNGMINVSSEVVINGGKFENIVEKTMTRHFAYVSALLTINDGEFYGKANAGAGGCFFCGAAAGGEIQVNGGKFTSLWTSGSVNRIFEVYYGGTINVTGGLFNTNGGITSFVTENTDDATKAAYPYVAK